MCSAHPGGEAGPRLSASARLQDTRARGVRMRSCVNVAKSRGNLKRVRRCEPRSCWAPGSCIHIQLSPRTPWGWVQGSLPSSKASELKRPEKRDAGGGRARGRSYRGCVSVRGQAPWGGGAALTEPPCPPAPAQACFLPKLLMSLQLQKPGDL